MPAERQLAIRYQNNAGSIESAYCTRSNPFVSSLTSTSNILAQPALIFVIFNEICLNFNIYIYYPKTAFNMMEYMYDRNTYRVTLNIKYQIWKPENHN